MYAGSLLIPMSKSDWNKIKMFLIPANAWSIADLIIQVEKNKFNI